jgi:hypothetical protein
MSTRGRIAKLERSHRPASAVLMWVQSVNQYPSLDDFVRACIDEGQGTTDLDRLRDRVVASVTDALKGEPPAELARATGIALRDAYFLYHLVLVLNSSVLEFARAAALDTLVLIHEAGSLGRDPLSDDVKVRRADREGANRVDAAWNAWQVAVDAILDDVRAEERVRTIVLDRYFDGQAVLFTQFARSWATLEALADLLDRKRVERAPRPVRRPARRRGRHNPDAQSDPMESRAASRANELIDDARIATYDKMGEHERAMAILESRFRA